MPRTPLHVRRAPTGHERAVGIPVLVGRSRSDPALADRHHKTTAPPAPGTPAAPVAPGARSARLTARHTGPREPCKSTQTDALSQEIGATLVGALCGPCSSRFPGGIFDSEGREAAGMATQKRKPARKPDGAPTNGASPNPDSGP